MTVYPPGYDEETLAERLYREWRKDVVDAFVEKLTLDEIREVTDHLKEVGHK